MVTERVRTLPTEPMEGEIVKSNPLLSFINIGQRGRMYYITSQVFFMSEMPEDKSLLKHIVSPRACIFFMNNFDLNICYSEEKD